MSDQPPSYQFPPPPPPFEPPSAPPLEPPTPPARRRRVWIPVLVVVALVAAAVGAYVVTRDSGADHPGEWAARVLDLVEFVERERELSFVHPVAIDFLDEAEWKEKGKIDEEDIVDDDVAFLEHGAGLFRALGLAEGELDLLEDTETLGTSGTVGFYDADEEKVFVRGSRLTTEVKATLVHELTHVLQDQHYDIGDRLDRVQEDDTDEESLRVLVEGDAERIEDAWIDRLSEADRREYEKESADTGDAAREALDALPQSLVTFFASSYILGAGFVGVLEADDGEDAIDDAFDDPPGPDEHVLDPLAYLSDDEQEAVDAPAVDGTPIEDLDGDFGAVSLFLVLAERIDPVRAFQAALGWGGDDFVAFTSGSQTCAALRFRGENRDTAREIAGALDDWAAAMPKAAKASVEHEGDLVDVLTCDPGVKADLVEGKGRSSRAMAVPATRTQLITSVLASQATLRQARCFADGVIDNVPFDLIASQELNASQNQQVQQVIAQQVARCR